ncbi:MAG: hypothetical protein JWP97_5771 [Labilithrix sp.]|nr:hypothetical protein [Labilithrix sp.]
MNTIGALIITSCTLYVPESGSWVLEVDHDLPTGAPAPKGKVACLVGGVPFFGTVDPASSGVFGTVARCRVVGALEWRSSLPKRDFQNPAGVLSSVVVAATAAELGIAATVVAPESLGAHFTRVAAPASQVLGRSGWWVSPAGITTVGPRPPSAPGLDFFLADYDPLSRTAQVSSLAPIMPGMIVPDPRLPGGALRVREVTQTWNADGASASLWMGETSSAEVQGPRIASAIQALAVAAMRPELLTHHAYTVVGQAPDGGYLLKSEVRGPVPDATPVVHWPGVPGLSLTLTPGVRVLVGFRGREPVVVGFDGSAPLVATWEATLLNLGGEVATGVATQETMTVLLGLLATFVTAVGSFASTPVVNALAKPLADAIVGAAGPLALQLALPTNFSTRVRAVGS